MNKYQNPCNSENNNLIDGMTPRVIAIIIIITSCTRTRVAVAHSGATEAGTRNMEMLHVGVSVHCMFNGTFKAD
jgi:hypothetical protein